MTHAPSDRAAQTTHFFTVDVEEYFQVNAFERVIQRNDWGQWPQRLDRSIPVLLERLARHEARGTFFTLGWVARENPDIVRMIVTAGHELASHGFWHRRVVTCTPDEFREDIRTAKQALEDVSGAAVVGYRAPSFSIIPGYEWAYDVLLEEGYAYDSSVFPIRRSGYGNPSAPRTPYVMTRPAGSLVEFPLATTSVLGYRVPAAGGGYLRQFPFTVIQRAFREADASGVGGTFYIHPWEIDPTQPRVPVPWLTRIRHYRGLDKTLLRIDRLLAEFRFGAMGPRAVAIALAERKHANMVAG
jgi:polysaccharide deacetylase family protein (PEP-CTERM system associated)